MIVVTGAAGFIGSALTRYLIDKGVRRLILVDDFTEIQKAGNLADKKGLELKERDDFPSWLEKYGANVDAVFHIGARTDTTEFDKELFERLNLNYSKKLWKACTKHEIPFYYASSAATYGDGSLGFKDDEGRIPELQPLNPYGWSKQEFDKWVLQQNEAPPHWAGFKFFNVYGPNEYHKGRMASVVLHAYRQIKETGKMKLFRSHHPDFRDGEQQRDFIYVKDIVDVLHWVWENSDVSSGIYNLGTGKARTFIDLALATFSAMGRDPQIEFIDTPADIRDKYQYFTEAEMDKLRGQGYNKPFTSLEEGIHDYVTEYLTSHKYY